MPEAMRDDRDGLLVLTVEWGADVSTTVTVTQSTSLLYPSHDKTLIYLHAE